MDRLQTDRQFQQRRCDADYRKKARTPNTGLAKVAVPFSADSFVVNQTLVLRINICGKNRHLRQAAKRYRQAQMTFRTTIIILSLAGLFHSCRDTKRGDKELEEQANRIIQRLDTPTLQFLDQWNYAQRGQANFWRKLSGDSSIFNCSFYPSVDTPKLSIYQVDEFLNYFKSNLQIDTAYYQIQFTKIGDTALNLVGTNNNGQDILLSKNLSLSKTFPEQNPFDILARLNQIKDTLNVIGISHYNVLGGFVQFYLPGGQHILTCISDTLLNSDHLNKFWKTEFSKGNRLSKDWNFRKLENPIDGG